MAHHIIKTLSQPKISIIDKIEQGGKKIAQQDVSTNIK